jgi:DsbC/DsbD-like thiol-disulfide interchange protein
MRLPSNVFLLPFSAAPLIVLPAFLPILFEGGDQTAPRRLSASDSARVVSRTTPHLAFTAAFSTDTIMPGIRLSIAVDVTPKQGMHVYAPGSVYRPVAMAIEPIPLLLVHDPVYPKPVPYLFKPLNEQILVYSAPFRIVIDITAGDEAAVAVQLRSPSQLTVRGSLSYQACDDTVCYLPTSVPVQWVLRVKRSTGVR